MKIVDRTDWKNTPALVALLCSLAGKISLFNPASTSLCDGTESRGETVQVRTRIKKPFKLQAHISQISVLVIDIIFI